MLYVLMTTKVPLSVDCVSRTASAVGMPLFVGGDGTFHLDMSDDSRRIRIEPLEADLTYWKDEPERLSQIEALGLQSRVYTMHYKSVELLRDTLCNLALFVDYILDDDYELFVTGQKFACLCQDNGNRNDWWLGGMHDVRN